MWQSSLSPLIGGRPLVSVELNVWSIKYGNAVRVVFYAIDNTLYCSVVELYFLVMPSAFLIWITLQQKVERQKTKQKKNEQSALTLWIIQANFPIWVPSFSSLWAEKIWACSMPMISVLDVSGLQNVLSKHCKFEAKVCSEFFFSVLELIADCFC